LELLDEARAEQFLELLLQVVVGQVNEPSRRLLPYNSI
jgi:hypothetical protein